jgi:hypothetical protein
MDRRIFFRNSAVLSAALIIPWLNSCRDIDPALVPAPDFLSHTLDKASLQSIGKAYLDKHPEQREAKAIAKQLLREGSEQKDLVGYFNQKIRNDFEVGNTIILSGWVLSETEAQQAALFTLLNKQ